MIKYLMDWLSTKTPIGRHRSFICSKLQEIIYNQLKQYFVGSVPDFSATWITVKTNRSSIMFRDPDLLGYDNLPIMPSCVLQARDLVQQETGSKYNLCLCNYYADGRAHIPFHSDREERDSPSHITSLSFGTSRRFVLRQIQSPHTQHVMLLNSGDLLYMGEGTQNTYAHSAPPDPMIKGDRISLTFRYRFPREHKPC